MRPQFFKRTTDQARPPCLRAEENDDKSFRPGRSPRSSESVDRLRSHRGFFGGGSLEQAFSPFSWGSASLALDVSDAF